MSQKVNHGILDFLSSIRLTLISLSLIGLSSILGTLIEQNRGPEFYKEVYPEFLSKLIVSLGLDDVFHSKWFMALLFIFFVNLTVCSIRRLKRDLSRKDHILFPREFDLNLKTSNRDRVLEILKDMGYRELKSEGSLSVLEKNRSSRYAHQFVHLSVILILLGGLIGLIYGFRGSVTLKVGEEKNEIILRRKNPAIKRLDFTLRLKDFRVQYYDDGTPKEYVSLLEILKNGDVKVTREIRVNDPLSFEGMNFYQASYGKEGKFYFSIDGIERVLDQRDVLREGDLSLKVLRYEEKVHDFGPGILVAYIDKDKLMTTWFLRDVEKMREKIIGGKRLRLIDIKEELYTVLEVTKDPGIPLVWVGFSGLILGLFVSFFFPSRRAYVLSKADGISLSIHCRIKEFSSSEIESLKRRLEVA